MKMWIETNLGREHFVHVEIEDIRRIYAESGYNQTGAGIILKNDKIIHSADRADKIEHRMNWIAASGCTDEIDVTKVNIDEVRREIASL